VDPDQTWVMPSGLGQLGVLTVIGVLGGIAQIFMTMAYQRARAATVASFDYTALVYGFLLGAILFDYTALVYGFLLGAIFFYERPDSYLIVGGGIVVVAGIYIIHRETVVARRENREPPVPPRPPNE